jgi:hypothetical protein
VCVGLVCDAHNRKTRVAQRSMVVQREWVTALATRCFVFFFLYNRVHHPDILSRFDQKKERDVVYNIGCVLYKNILLSKRNFRSYCRLLAASTHPLRILSDEKKLFSLRFLLCRYPFWSRFSIFIFFYRRMAAGWKTHSKCSNWRFVELANWCQLGDYYYTKKTPSIR